MKDLIEPYLAVYGLKVKAETAARVRGHLRAFVAVLGDSGFREGCALTREHLVAYRRALVGRGLAAYTQQGYLSPVRGFVSWLYHEGYLLVNPYPKEWDEIRARSALRLPPSEKKARMLLERVLEQGLSPIRDRAMLELAYASGLRRGELAALSLRDLRGDWLLVRGKGGHERVVPVGATAKAWLLRYMATERRRKCERFNPHEDALFLSYRGQRMGAQSFTNVVTRHRERRDTVCLHSFRHACASHMLARGASVVVLQKLLGHRKLSTTQIYTHVETGSLRTVLEKYHPRG